MAQADEGKEEKGKKQKRSFSISVPDPSVSPSQSFLMGSSQAQEDTELPSVAKCLPKHWGVLAVKNMGKGDSYLFVSCFQLHISLSPSMAAPFTELHGRRFCYKTIRMKDQGKGGITTSAAPHFA